MAPFMIDPQGHICIGTADAKGYALAIGGPVIAESMTVKVRSQWPDLVFKPKYRLTSLKDLESYISKNDHLPGIPSQKEVTDHGVELGEINKLLLKKIEELTLYIIAEKHVSNKQAESITRMSRLIKRQGLQLKQLSETIKNKKNK